MKPLFDLILEEATKNGGAAANSPAPPSPISSHSWRRHRHWLPFGSKKRAKKAKEDGIHISSPVFAVRSKLLDVTHASSSSSSSPPPPRRCVSSVLPQEASPSAAEPCLQQQKDIDGKPVAPDQTGGGDGDGIPGSQHFGFVSFASTKKRGGADLDDCHSGGGGDGRRLYDSPCSSSSTATEACSGSDQDRGRGGEGGGAEGGNMLMSAGGWPCRLRLGELRRNVSFAGEAREEQQSVWVRDVHTDSQDSGTKKEEAVKEEEGGGLDLYPYPAVIATEKSSFGFEFNKTTDGGDELAAMGGGAATDRGQLQVHSRNSCLQDNGEALLEMAMGLDLMVLRARVERDMALAEALQLRLALDAAHHHLNYHHHFCEPCCYHRRRCFNATPGPPPPASNTSSVSLTHLP